MRKNLFLTLALIVASIATVNAQWSKVLSTVDGLPGVTDKAINCVVAETGLITPDAPINGLRWTVIETSNMEKPDGHPCTAIAEFVIRDAEGNALNYVATGNSFINESTGWPALNDGLYNGYMHTNWSGGNPTGAHHYIEFTFDEPVSAFSLEWANRQGNPKNAPTLVVLTEKGVDGEAVEIPAIPTSTYALGSQIASLDELLAASYVSMEAETFKGDWSKDVTGWLGNRFYTAPNALVFSDSIQNYNAGMAMQVVPTGDGETYYLFWPETGRYFGLNNLTSALNQNADCHFVINGAGATTTAQAAKLTIVDNGNGTFTMSFTTPDGEGAYLAAPPTNGHGIFSVNELFKAQNEAKDYVAGYGYPCCFKFKFYSAEYEKAAHMIVNSLREPVANTKYLSELFGGAQGSEVDFPDATTHADMMANVEKAEAIIAGGATTAAEAAALIAELQTNQIWYLYTVAYQKMYDAYAYYDELAAAGLFCEDDSPVNGCYTEGSWNNTVAAVLDAWMTEGAIANVENNGPLYTYYNDFINGLGSLEQAFETFESGKISFVELPLFYGEKDGLPGTVSSFDTRTWTSPSIRLQEPINGFRITFARSMNFNGGVVGSQDRAVVLGELIIMDADGNRVAMTGDNVVTNAIEPSEGSLAGLFDGTFDASGNLTSEIGSFYHSPWSDANGWDSNEYIYFDITLPQPMDGIKFAFHSRKGNKSFNPADICVGVYGEEYDPIAARPNTYNANIGKQVTSAEEITDWGVYAIQGIINTNPNPDAVAEPIEPMWYAGETTFHKSVVREDCAYFFTKNADGTFKIMSIGESKYWTAGGGLTSYSNEAGNIHIVPSTNADFAGQNTLVLYTDVENPEPQGAEFEYVDEESELEIIVDSVGVTCPYRVLMDWGAGVGLASRVCIDYQPGVNPANYGEQAENVELLLENPKLLAGSSAGDYLHFNKTSGEGEWKIYQLSLDNPYYYWATSLATVAEGLGFIAGNNPGEYADLGTFATDLAAVQAVVENNDYAGAEAAAKKLAATLEAMAGGEYTQNPVTEGVYAIITDARGANHVLNVNESGELKTVTASAETDFTKGTALTYLFQLEVPANLDEFLLNEEITEEQKDKVFTIKHIHTGNYIIAGDGTSQPVSVGDDKDQAGAFLFTGGDTNYFTIAKVNNYEGNNQLHESNWGDGTVLHWNGQPTASSASAWRLVRVDVDPTSVDSIVTEGSEVVSVKYYTAGGAESAAPVKGINVVTIVYSNGVTETKKVVVE
ncbi:MAG: hypothetical protein IKA35_07650 [Bacteroidaceae bacterium]|nr:hypothetical protein [Bacteroidaceae bacterium]